MKNTERVIQLIILFTAIYLAFFYKVTLMAYRQYDEVRLATSAYEMTKTGNLIVTTFDYQPDMWNTKPPLMIWAQAVCIKIWGINEFATRFPSTLCATLTALLVFYFVLYTTKNGWAALLTSVAFCTAKGCLIEHALRSGDYDSMLVFFTTGAILSLFLYTEGINQAKRNRYLLLFFAALTLAALTKGIAAMLYTPALFIYIVVRRQLIATLSNKYFHVGLAGFLIFAVGYYFLREHYNPGYLKAVYENELGGRLLTELEYHTGPFNLYWLGLKFGRFGNWFWLLPIGLILLPFQSNKKMFRVSAYAYLCAAVYLLVISSAKTKLFWYDLPLYPLLAIAIGITVFQLSSIIASVIPYFKKTTALIAICIFASSQPVYEAWELINTPIDNLEKDWFYDASYYLRNAAANNKDMTNTVYFRIANMYSPHYSIYIYRLREQGNSIAEITLDSNSNFGIGTKVIAHQQQTRDFIESHYTFTLVEVYYGVKVYKITGQRS